MILNFRDRLFLFTTVTIGSKKKKKIHEEASWGKTILRNVDFYEV